MRNFVPQMLDVTCTNGVCCCCCLCDCLFWTADNGGDGATCSNLRCSRGVETQLSLSVSSESLGSTPVEALRLRRRCSAGLSSWWNLRTTGVGVGVGTGHDCNGSADVGFSIFLSWFGNGSNMMNSGRSLDVGLPFKIYLQLIQSHHLGFIRQKTESWICSAVGFIKDFQQLESTNQPLEVEWVLLGILGKA